MVRHHRAEIFVDTKSTLGEGPVWDASTGTLIWVDIAEGRILRQDADTGKVVALEVEGSVGSVALRHRGGLAIAVQEGFLLLNEDSSAPHLLPVQHEAADAKMNDGKCDGLGRFWAGSATKAHPGSAALYRLEPTGRIELVLRGVTMSNGIDWSPDDRLMYYVDSAEGRVDVFDFVLSGGTPSRRRTLVGISSALGIPDGLTVDSDGCVWLAIWGAGEVHRYTPTGDLDAVVQVPVTKVTSCTFGGAELRDLFITSARAGLSREELKAQPAAGCVFQHSASTPGLATRLYGG